MKSNTRTRKRVEEMVRIGEGETHNGRGRWWCFWGVRWGGGIHVLHGGYSKEERLARSAIGKKTNKAYMDRISKMKENASSVKERIMSARRKRGDESAT